MGGLVATRQPEAVLPLLTDQRRAQVKPRAQAADQTWNLISAEVALEHNSVAVVAACARIVVTPVAIAVMMLPRLAIVAVILPQA
jgi:hypothetical protein